MPDLLLISLESKTYFELEAEARTCGFRVKSTADPKIAQEWLSLKPFDVVLADSALETADLQAIAMALWKQAPGSPCIVFDFQRSEETERLRECRLFGMDAVCGPQGKADLQTVLRLMAHRASVSSGPTKILVVEDLDSPRDIICFYLESLGYSSVQGVRSAKDAIKELEKDPKSFGCVITDIRMPEMGGRELIDFVRHHQALKNLPMIALTAYGTVDTLIDCLKAGASGFLVKPPKRDDLVRELARAMRISRLGASPRLANDQEAELLRNLLIERGFS